MLCLTAWCSFVLAPKGNTKVFSKLSGKFLGWIQVNKTNTILDVQAKASKLLVHALFCHPCYLVVYDSKGKRSSPRQNVFIRMLKWCANTLEQIPSEVWVVWDEDLIQRDVANIASALPNTTFDGQQITTLLNNHKARVNYSIELYSLAKTFKCCSKATSFLDLRWLDMLCDLERVDIMNCGIQQENTVHYISIPLTVKQLSLVCESVSCRTSFTLDGVSRLVNLASLKVQGTLVKSIPDEISKLSNLARLDLAFNQLSGVVPSSIQELVNLEELFLQHNHLQGRLCLARCTKLQRLNVSHNMFGAELLEDMRFCCAQHIDYSYNTFL